MDFEVPRDGEAPRDGYGRFSGVRHNVEQVPRLPTFAARWSLEDPRGRPYLVFWTRDDGALAYVLRMEWNGLTAARLCK